MKIKKLPIGIESFNEIRTEGYYYVDKTGFIRELLNSGGKVTLFTRPRRFGKSLNISMLKAFFEIGTDVALFNGLEISEEKEICDKYLGKFPVISITLKDIEGADIIEATDMLENVINEEAIRMQWLMDSPELTKYDKRQLERLLNGDFKKISYLMGSLKLLTRLLYKHYGKKAILLIDEYDVPLDKAYANGYYTKMTGYIRLLLSEALKTNDYLQFAVITGCLKIAKESIFTGLNNFKTRTISDVEYAEYFGFTDNEVQEMLRYYGVEERFNAVKEWYDGYHFGNIDVYCPWDVINQCDKLRVSKDAEMESHWANSSSNTIIRDIIEYSTATTKNQIESLVSGDSIEQAIISELTYADLNNEDNTMRQTYLWSVLFYTGYLTTTTMPENKLYKLVIPNREIHGIYEKQILSWFKTTARSNTTRWNQFCNAVKNGNAKAVETLLNEFMANSISIRDTCTRNVMKENFYHGMLLGLLQTEENWIVKSNLESGIGYTDALVEIPLEKIGCIFEIKYARHGAFDAACAEAIQQIEQKQYDKVLIQDEIQKIHKYGVACYKKTCRIVHKNLCHP